jgi:hypothetical protein
MITQIQKEIIRLLEQNYKPKDISFRRKTSIRAVYKIVKGLKDKGIITGSFKKGFNFQPTSIPLSKKLLRLHGQEFNLPLKYKEKPYFPQETTLKIQGNTVRFYRNSIEIYSKQSFYGHSTQEVRQKSMDYFKEFFIKLQQTYKIIFKSVKQVNAHYSEVENELAKDYNQKKEKIAISAKEDNKIWSKIDFSLNENEFETLHPLTAEADINKVKDFFQDVRDKEHFKPSELTTQVIGLTQNQEMFNENLVKHFQVLDDMRKTMKDIRKYIKKLK